ncbi:MAG TPA: Ig domain-containing protein, partial [Bryobacteraceae bacterium]|nr:Ig domain-containing protein [Bryobacteraceae bacterium]
MRLPILSFGVVLTVSTPLFAQNLTLTNNSLPAGTIQQNYSAQLTATGGSGSYSFGIGNGTLPPGLTLNQQNGLISGVPTQGGVFNFTASVFDLKQETSASKALSITINSPSTLAITSTSPLPPTEAGQSYSFQFTATGGTPPYSFFAQPDPFTPSGLPPGFTLSQNGLLSGVATAGGTFNFTIFLQDATSTKVQQPFSIVVAGTLAFTTASPLPDGMRGAAYSQVISATGGVPPYIFFIANPPPGLTIDTGGNLSGTPQVAGTFTFQVGVTDKMSASVTKSYQITIQDISTGPGLPVKTTPTNLTFNAAFQGPAPPPQFLDVTPLATKPSSFMVQVDTGPNTAAPNWISVTPLGGLAPSQLQVKVDQGTMAPGTYTARILVIDNSPSFTTVTVTLIITDISPKFDASPAFLRFTARASAPGSQEQVLVIRNVGGSAGFTFSAAILPGDSNFISSVTPNSGSISRNVSVAVRVRINTGSNVGSFREVVRFTTPFGTFDVPVNLFVAAAGPILGVDVTGLRFQARSGSGFTNAQTVRVLNTGDPTTTLTWTADLVSGSDLFTFSTSAKTASFANPGTILIVPTQSALQKSAGAYYALLRITSPALNSPQYVVLLLDLSGVMSAPLPDLSPTGFLFIVSPGVQSAAQTLNVHTTSANPVPFEAAAATSDGGNWLLINPAAGTASSNTPGQVSI